MVKIWNPKDDGDPKMVGELASQLNIDYTLANLLVQRGITNFSEAKKFFRPDLKNLHDPFLMKDMDKAVERLNTAIKLQEKILVYGDYDVDGTTAVSLVYSFFKTYSSKIDFYIPDRYTEGYGISTASIDYAYENGFTLIIALDCGIKAIDKISYAKSKGIDFIIGDHHRPDEIIPDAYAVLDPKQPDCQYPYKELSGCGVGFKLVQAFSKKNKIPLENAYDFLDLVVISIASDIVPITGENRIFAYYGLKIINTKPRPGIEAILACAKVTRRPRQIYTHNKSIFSKELTINDLVFTIGPRINAAGRLENGITSVELLNAENLEDAKTLAERINDINNERRNLDNIATQNAIEDLDNDPTTIYKKTTVVYNPEWYKGVVGIVASRLTEKYYRPTIVFTKSNGLITGSARSVKHFDIYDAINACSDLLEHFGGHTYAAGLSLKEENLQAFIEKFEKIVTETIDDQMLIPVIDYDTDLDLKDINSKFYKTLKSFAPFGPGNLSPVFRTTGVVDTGLARLVGKNHIKLTVTQLNKGGYPISAIAFQQGDYFDQIVGGLPFNIVYHIEENEWNNMISLQLNIKDIKIIE
ncbi:single-stranded-DNA-specific exonuclease RecJ [Odoribacter sp. OttesenSCG-928-L07]|nr:single-stranded-DNA-specific exonuclease RecJ [Odoribacter sp. OttesenSCG-928-L07]MDL2238692.1 single-stranded-DNA-specific exonuclease RecJ [Bacteroidales bacterium OttesenSCG-928-L14]